MYTESDLHAASTAGVLDAPQLARLLDFLKGRVALAPAASGPRFDVAHLLWYAGALIVIGAMGLFSTLAFSQMGGQALAITAVVYAAVFWIGGHYLWTAKQLTTPGGLLIAIAVSMAPLATYGVQDALGWWGQFGRPGDYKNFYPLIKGSWILMEVAAIVTAAIALRFYRFPFIVSIIAFALWFMSMDLAPWIGGTEYADWETRRQVSIWFGAAMLVVAYITDRVQKRGDFAFWLYLFGMLAFWGGITSTSGGTMLAEGDLLRDERRAAVHSACSSAGECLRGVRRDRHRDLSRRSRQQGVQGLAAVPVRAVADRRRGDRGGTALLPQPGPHHGVVRGEPARRA